MSPIEITLTNIEAYRAMHLFVEAYFERGGKKGKELALFLSYARPGGWEPSPENPVGSGDPAAWSDWMAAIEAVRNAE